MRADIHPATDAIYEREGMKTSMTGNVEPQISSSSPPLLPKSRTILERPVMEFRPFGSDEHGRTIRDLSGMSIRAIILDLEKTIARERGPGAGHDAVRELCALLNRRIKDSVYHVTPEFLKNPWNSYSYEFASYLYEFCEQLTGDPQFIYRGGMEKVSPIIQVLARPFSLEQIYGMFPYFGNKFASGSIECRVIEVTPMSATLAMRFADHTLRQFGPFRRRCAYMVCQSAQGIFAAVPARVHGLPPATLTTLSCIADDDEWCRWRIRWQDERAPGWRRRVRLPAPSPREAMPYAGTESAPGISDHPPVAEASGHFGGGSTFLSETRSTRLLVYSGLAGLSAAAVFGILYPAMPVGNLILTALLPVLLAGLLMNRRLWNESRQREALIGEQMSFVESRHEELREAYLGQEQTRVELRRKVTQLTALHRAGLLFSSTLDRDTLMQQVLDTLTCDLHYDRAMISFFDPITSVIQHARIVGVPAEVQAFVLSGTIPVTDPDSPEGTVVLQGRPLLIEDIHAIGPALHPLNQRLAEMSRTKALIVVPLKTKDRILGTLTVDRTNEGSLTQDDLDLMTTVGRQVAIALDNAAAYQQIEELNEGLEFKVRERTAALEQADRLRSQFLSHVSHELKTPLTSIKGFVQNLLDGLTGPLNEKQQGYLSRMLENSDRLLRMIDDLLDRTSIEAGRVELVAAELNVESCLTDALEQLRPFAAGKQQQLDLSSPSGPLIAWADRDRVIQVIVNLIHNAIKYTPNGGVITVLAEPLIPRMAQISVRDTGPGIPVECLDKIFDPFFRIQQRQRSGPKGLGLGLSIVKTLVELQGGVVVAKNRPQGGLEVSFTLPLRSPAVHPGIAGVNRNVLLVDDDPDIRQLLIDRLCAHGYQPFPAEDAQQALDAVATEEFCGVILDIGIGPIDGLEVLKRIRQTHPHIPVIMITASGSQELAVRSISMGAHAYLLKPFEAGALQDAMNTWFCLE